MVVDDTAQNLVLMTELLRDDYRIIVANGGERALSLLSSGTLPDLILLDIMMPDLDGYEVLQRIKANPVTMYIPVIFMTGKSEMVDEIWAWISARWTMSPSRSARPSCRLVSART